MSDSESAWTTAASWKEISKVVAITEVCVCVRVFTPVLYLLWHVKLFSSEETISVLCVKLLSFSSCALCFKPTATLTSSFIRLLHHYVFTPMEKSRKHENILLACAVRKSHNHAITPCKCEFARWFMFVCLFMWVRVLRVSIALLNWNLWHHTLQEHSNQILKI